MKRFFGLRDLCMLISCLGMPGFSPAAFAGSGPTTLPSPVPSAFNYYYGISVAMTPNGSIAVVAANAGGYGLGTQPAVYVFQYANGAWNASPIITVPDPAAFAAPTDLFGSAVSVSGISNNSFVLVVGAPGGGVVNSATVSYGLVYIYQCTLGSTPACIQVAQLPDPGITGLDEFGSALAVSSDGATLLVGAWGSNEPGGNGTDDNNEGAVYVYTASNGTWITAPRTTLLDPAPTCASFGTPPNQQSVCDEFGYAVSLAGTGNNITALIGAPGAVVSNNGTLEPGEGAAFFFGSNSNGALQPLTEIMNPNTAACSDVIYLRCDEFGHAVALAANGSAAAVAAPNATISTAAYGEAGAVSVISQASAGGWGGGASVGCTYTNSNQNMNTIYSGIGGFGWSLALSSDGSTLTVGMPEGAEGTNNGGYGGTGEIDVYDGLPQAQCSNTPAQISVDPSVAQSTGGAAPADFFGGAVALSQDAGVLLAGAPQTSSSANGGTKNNGAAYVYGTPSGQGALALALAAAPSPVAPGGNLVYQFTVTNTGTAQVNALTLSDPLPAGVTFVSASAAGGSCSGTGGTITCTFAALAGLANWQPTITVSTSSTPQKIIDSVTVTAGPASANASVTTVVDTPPTANNGKLTVIGGAATSGTLSATPGSVSALTYAIVAQPANGTVVLNNASTGALTYTPNAGFLGTDSFTFNVSDGLLTSSTATESVTSIVSTVALALSFTGPNNVTVNAGQNLAYGLIVTNTSTSESAVNVVLTGTLAAGVTLVTDSPNGATCSAGGSSYSCTLGSLGPGASWTPSVMVQIGSSDVGQTMVAASISVMASNSSNNPAVTASVTVAQATSILSVVYQPLFEGLISENTPACNAYDMNGNCLQAGTGLVCSNNPGTSCAMMIEVMNTSSTQPADNLGLVITIPQDVTVSSVTGSPGLCVLFNVSSPVNPSVTLTCGLGTLSPGHTWLIIFTETIASTAQNGQTEISQATAAAANTPSATQSYGFTVGTPTTVAGSNTGGLGALDWLEIAALGGLLWLGRWRKKRMQ